MKSKYLVLLGLFAFTGCTQNINSSLQYKDDKLMNSTRGSYCLEAKKDFIPNMGQKEEQTMYTYTSSYFFINGVNVINNCEYVFKTYKKVFTDPDTKAIFSNSFKKERFAKSENKNYGVLVYKLSIGKKEKDDYISVWEGIYQEELLENTRAIQEVEKENSDQDIKVYKSLINAFFADTNSKMYTETNMAKKIATGAIEVVLTNQVGKSISSLSEINNITTPSLNVNP